MAVVVDTGSLRRAAASLRAHALSAGQAGAAIPSSIDSSIWRSDAASAVSSALPGYRAELSHGSGIFDNAASLLEALAWRLDQKLSEISVARRKEAEANEKAATAALSPGLVGDTISVVMAAQHRRDLENEANRLIASTGDALKQLAAQAPRSKAEHFRVGGIPWYREIAQGWHDAGGLWAAPGNIATGVVSWGRKMGAGILDLALHSNVAYMLINPDGYWDYNVGMLRGIRDLGLSAWHHPGDTAYAFFEIDALKENPARWIGQIGPDAALTVIGGAGAITKGGKAISSLRALDETSDVAAAIRAGKVLGPIRVEKVGTTLAEGELIWTPIPHTRAPVGDTLTRIKNVNRHFGDHGQEFGYTRSGEYFGGAKSFVTNPPSDLEVIIRSNGERVFYSRSENTIAVVTSNNEFKTFFRPNKSDNYQYFLDQAR